MKVLVHFDSEGEKAQGIWWVDGNGSVKNLYTRPDSPEAARGRLIVYNKTAPECDWSRWFDLLSNRPPYFEVWATYDSMGFTPEQLLSSLKPSPPLLFA